jgi:hypothetical protein
MVSLVPNTTTSFSKYRTGPAWKPFPNRSVAPDSADSEQLTLQFGQWRVNTRVQVVRALAKVLKAQSLTEEQAFNRPKHDRIDLFLNVLKTLPPANSFGTAHQQMDIIMREIEQKAKFYGRPTMSVDPNFWYAPITSKIHIAFYTNHTNLIGDNGAIAIYFDGDDMHTDPGWFQQAKPLFQKPGRDGKDIWGNPVAQEEENIADSPHQSQHNTAVAKQRSSLQAWIMDFWSKTSPAHHRSSGKG